MSTVQLRKFIPSSRRLTGAIIGGLVAGLVLSVWMLIGEVSSGMPSQLTEMERQIAGWLGAAPASTVHIATLKEEYLGNLGHWLLSAVAGAAYAIFWRRDRSVVLNGLTFGAAFYVAAHAVVGPIIGLTPGMWNMPREVFLMGCVINGFFGLCTAYFAHQFDRAENV
ncbi:DUF1440 domain-containing protein [Paraburkholderia sp. 22B1P]|uniref:DUF1440 domain-containing protein n=1 Tax=Paraburkholderia sp. 22B1P TaxID=3080498 RepID=UPI00308A4E61|nr:hypothetical protein PBP221_86140 [Paraburkholderia sp. 22B1P]